MGGVATPTCPRLFGGRGSDYVSMVSHNVSSDRTLTLPGRVRVLTPLGGCALDLRLAPRSGQVGRYVLLPA